MSTATNLTHAEKLEQQIEAVEAKLTAANEQLTAADSAYKAALREGSEEAARECKDAAGTAQAEVDFLEQRLEAMRQNMPSAEAEDAKPELARRAKAARAAVKAENATLDELSALTAQVEDALTRLFTGDVSNAVTETVLLAQKHGLPIPDGLHRTLFATTPAVRLQELTANYQMLFNFDRMQVNSNSLAEGD